MLDVEDFHTCLLYLVGHWASAHNSDVLDVGVALG